MLISNPNCKSYPRSRLMAGRQVLISMDSWILRRHILSSRAITFTLSILMGYSLSPTALRGHFCLPSLSPECGQFHRHTAQGILDTGFHRRRHTFCGNISTYLTRTRYRSHKLSCLQCSITTFMLLMYYVFEKNKLLPMWSIYRIGFSIIIPREYYFVLQRKHDTKYSCLPMNVRLSLLSSTRNNWNLASRAQRRCLSSKNDY